MGTRADFYVGVGKDAEWLGSIAFDGYPDGPVLESGAIVAVTEDAFRTAIAKLLKQDDATTPEQGWPWPWNDSGMTDYAYCFDKDHVHICGAEDDDGNQCGHAFPDMSARKKVTFGKRSGLLIIG